MTSIPDPLPTDLAEAHAMILAERAARCAAEAEAAAAKEMKQVLDLEIERLKLEIARLKRHRFGPSSERSIRLEQLELALSDLEETVAAADASEALRAAERPAPAQVQSSTSSKPARRPLSAHLPRTRLVYPAPAVCPGCGGEVRKLGEEMTETLERLPARWLVIQSLPSAKRPSAPCERIETE